jgi:hypothetical protein
MPREDCAPLHAPLAVQPPVLLRVQFSVAISPTVAVDGVNDIERLGGGLTLIIALSVAPPPGPVQLSAKIHLLTVPSAGFSATRIHVVGSRLR